MTFGHCGGTASLTTKPTPALARDAMHMIASVAGALVKPIPVP